MRIDTDKPVELQGQLARYQFSLRSLLLVLTAFSVLFAVTWLAGKVVAIALLFCCLLVSAGAVADMIDWSVLAVSRGSRWSINGHGKRVLVRPQTAEVGETKAEWIVAHRKLIGDLRQVEQDAAERYDNATGTLEDVLRSRAVCLLAEIDLERHQPTNHHTSISKPR